MAGTHVVCEYAAVVCVLLVIKYGSAVTVFSRAQPRE